MSVNNGGKPWRIVSRKVTVPLIRVDCSDWGQLLEVTLPQAESCSQSEMTQRLSQTIDELDKAQQGSGFRFLDAKTQGSDVVFAFAPIEPENNTQRIQSIAAALAGSSGSPVKKNGVTKVRTSAA
jgi:hypothetical protein